MSSSRLECIPLKPSLTIHQLTIVSDVEYQLADRSGALVGIASLTASQDPRFTVPGGNLFLASWELQFSLYSPPHSMTWSHNGEFYKIIASGLACDGKELVELGIVVLISLVLGSFFVFLVICKKVMNYWRGRHQISVVPRPVARYLDHIKRHSQRLSPPRDCETQLKSFGVYCGSFENPPTPSQTSLLSRWDLIILDPLQAGVLDALSSQCTSRHILGRMDVEMVVPFEGRSSTTEVIRCLDKVIKSLVTSFKRPEDTHSRFTGVLLAGWLPQLPPVLCNELVTYVDGVGLDVYLEISAPNFLTESQCRAINMDLIKGIVCRNGSILPDGNRRNFFQMDSMRPALRALAAKSSTTRSTVMMWDAVDDDEEIEHAVVRRSFNWCRFSNALSWIGSRGALTDAEVASRTTVAGEPLGAMMWLKGAAIMKAHDIWRSNDKISRTPCGDHAIYDSLEELIPNLTAKLSLASLKHEDPAESQIAMADDCDWPLQIPHAPRVPLQFSTHGINNRGLGCFQLGLRCSADDFVDLVQTQRRLKDLGMLESVKPEELRRIGGHLRALSGAASSWANTPEESQAVKDLLSLLIDNNGDDNDSLKVYVGLDSGFRAGSDAQFCQFWGLYDYDPSSSVMNLYISRSTQDRAGTILHTFMSSRICTRAQCFMAEIALSEQTESLTVTWELPPRLVQDIEQLTPAETILLLQRLRLSEWEECPILAERIRSCCEHQLLEVPSIAQLKALNATAYLRGDISAEDLITSRLGWYRDTDCECPDPPAAISLFREINARITDILMGRQSQLLSKLEVVLQVVLQKKQIDASADLFALSVFCAFRKLALNEVYMEITDRNPLPNPQSDQAACFAEMFALGSGCESYFDMTSTALGKILSEKSQSYYKLNQPPLRDDAATELPTAYASKMVDLDPNAGRQEVPLYYQITFLGIFAVPAFVDILMLSMTGRGLYLTAKMPPVVKEMATTALVAALVLCGAFGTWICTGGSYYLYSMAFSAMNMFVLSRFIAGLAVCTSCGILAFIIIGVKKGFYAGLIFLLYFIILNTYLTLLATLAVYQFPGFKFQSGRLIIITRLPILLISPIVAIWFKNHDVLVYLTVLSVFLASLLLGARSVMSQWSNWYLKIPCVTDADVVKWYNDAAESRKPSSRHTESAADITSTTLPRKTLMAEVLKERNRHPWTRSTANDFVLKLADGYSATIFMMDWYCKYSRTKMPYPYSPTWNLQCKAAVETLLDIQKGLKLHSAFVHWRNSGDELWSGILYFIIALLDKWVSLLSGDSILGLSNATKDSFRLPVGFGLAYYLLSAVFLDSISQPLWQLAQKSLPQPISSLKFLQEAVFNDAKAKRKLYWKYFRKFFLVHFWGLCLTTALMWSLESDRDATKLYLSYVGAYSGLLWYQYNRIFTGPLAYKEPLVAVMLALPAGLVLHHHNPKYAFNNVIALSFATWMAAILSAWTVHRGARMLKYDISMKRTVVVHSGTAVGSHTQLSQPALSEIFDSVCALPAELRYRLDPFTHPGVQVMEILISHGKSYKSELLNASFPSGKKMVCDTVDRWKSGETVIELVPMRHLMQQEQKMRVISRTTSDRLHIFIFLGPDLVGEQWIMDIRRNCKIIAEAVIQATTESRLGLSHDHSMLAELLATSNSDDVELSIPEGVKRQLQNSTTDRVRVIRNGDKALLQSLLLGLDCDTEWDNLPRNIRSFLLKRSCGEPCQISDDQISWISSRFCKDDCLDVEEYVARCNLSATLTILVSSFATAVEADYTHRDQPEPPESSYERKCTEFTLPQSNHNSGTRLIDVFKYPLSRAHRALRYTIKFIVVALVADPEFQRELDYLMSRKHWIIRWPVTFCLSGVWIFCKTLQGIIFPLILFGGRENISRLHRNMKGMNTVIEKHKIIVESLSGPSTCFFTTQPDGSSQLRQYSGRHDQDPKEIRCLMAVNSYTSKLVLYQREEYANQSLVNVFTYEYHNESLVRDGEALNSKLPMERRCIKGNLEGQVVQYDKKGCITSGSFIKDGNLIQFKFWYRKDSKFDDELLRAEFILQHIKVFVSWCAPPANNPEKLDKWIPYSKVTEVTFEQGPEVYKSKWHYEHKFHPVISTTLNGQTVATPPGIQHDWFNVLRKPENCSFMNDNPLFWFNSVNTNFFSRMLRLNRKRHPISTSRARTHLWKSWKEGKELDAVSARWLDEVSLRSDKDLKPYWIARDFCRLKAAEEYLHSRADTIMARVDIDPEISSWTPLAFKISDLASFGQGGDARINTRTQSAQMLDTDSELHILAMDTGTWPNEGGGVSACRRDMVNNLDTIKWHIVAESATDFGVPKFQIEKNVQSLTVLPLWGLDFLTPTHGIFENCLDSAVQQKSHNTTDADILKRFVPILSTLVRGSRAIRIDRQLVKETTKALVDLNTYFESGPHWSDVWKSDIVKQAWRELWLTEDMDNVRPLSEWLDAEHPTVVHLDLALDMWHRYLFIFSIPVPERIPDVFQASHHFTAASYGIVCKIKRNCTLHIWDHCISWREVTVFLSSAMSFDPPFVCNSLISLSRLASVLTLHHADVVLPCADFFNPGWEVELGTQEGALEHRHGFKRKIDPVVNGICNMENFQPIEKIKTNVPTVVMLSHVRFVKDIKTAILAADIIVNDWGFTEYQLDIYGDMEKAPSYSVECQEIVASKSLRDNVALKGLGSPSKVLEDAWLFLNSSVSEGLPLAMGEAALTGVPVVCTDVGASFRVVSDPVTFERFSAVVAPNDAYSLARAQINVLGLLDEWSKFAEDEDGYLCPKLSLEPTPEEVKQVSKRMYEKTEQRRRLGMMGRTNVLNSFSSDRYLREHEQMLWIGKYQAPSYRSRVTSKARSKERASTSTSSSYSNSPISTGK